MTSPQWDMPSHYAAQRAKPEAFVTTRSCLEAAQALGAIRGCRTLETLNRTFQSLARQYKGDTEQVDRMKAVAAKRRVELSDPEYVAKQLAQQCEMDWRREDLARDASAREAGRKLRADMLNKAVSV